MFYHLEIIFINKFNLFRGYPDPLLLNVQPRHHPVVLELSREEPETYKLVLRRQ